MKGSGDIESVDPEALLRDAPDAVVVHDMEDRILFWNTAAELIYGGSSAERLGQTVTDCFYRDQEQRQRARAFLLENGLWEGECEHYDSSGAIRLVRVRQRLRRDRNGDPHSIVSFNSDVTEQRQLSAAEKRIRTVANSNILAGGMAHDLNNALAPITLATSLLERQVDDTKALKVIEMIDKCAQRGANLISDMVAFERGRFVGIKPISVFQLVRVLRIVADQLVPQAIDFHVEVADDLRGIFGDLSELEECFRNIIENAVEALEQKSDSRRLTVDLRNRYIDSDFGALGSGMKSGDYISITFTDNGPGADEDALERMGEPRFTSKAPDQGFGFGLSRALAITKGHNGRLVFSGESGSGLAVSVFLPAADAAEKKTSNSAKTIFGAKPGNGEGILLVDDEASVIDALRMTLEGLGYKVVAAQDGSEALALYSNHREAIDVVIVDIAMPLVDGPEFCRALKKMDPDAKIIVSSGQQQTERLQAVKECGIKHSLAKPFSVDALASEISRVLSDDTA